MRVIRSRSGSRRARSAFRDAEQVGVEVHVLVDCQITVQSEALGHVADLILDGVHFVRDTVAGHPGFAFGGIHQAAQQPQRGGFAGAVRTHQAEDFAARDFHIEMVDGDKIAEAARQVIRANDRLGGQFSSISASTGMLDFSSCFGLSTSILMR